MSIHQESGSNGVRIRIDEQTLSGDIAQDLKLRFIELLDSGESQIELDLAAVDYVDSSGLGKLLFMSKKISQKNGQFKITRCSETLFEFLDSLAITKVIDISQ